MIFDLMPWKKPNVPVNKKMTLIRYVHFTVIVVTMVIKMTMKVDIRIGQYPDGSPHDHGTGFRIQERYLTKLFKNKNILIEKN